MLGQGALIRGGQGEARQVWEGKKRVGDGRQVSYRGKEVEEGCKGKGRKGRE